MMSVNWQHGSVVSSLAALVLCHFLPIFQNKAQCSIVSHFVTFKQSFQTPVTLLYFILLSRLSRFILKHKKQQQTKIKTYKY